MGYLNLKLKLNINKGKERQLKLDFSRSVLFRLLIKGIFKFMIVFSIDIMLLISMSYPLALQIPAYFVKSVEAEKDDDNDISDNYSLDFYSFDEKIAIEKSEIVAEIEKEALKDKYEVLAGVYYYANVEAYLQIIDEVLSEKGLDNNALFIQAMFFIGQHESHWNTGSKSSMNVGREYPTGIFQFLPSTFRSVSGGDIYNAEDQIRAFVTMVERSRVDEFSTLFIGGLNPLVRKYVLSF